jgi:hypothetical protein
MATTRDFVSLGEFAKNADEIQEPGPPVRVPDEAYRNTSFTQFQQQIGKQFGVVPVSENFNQQVFNQTQFTDLIDKKGIPGWTDNVTYDKPAVVHASDGRLYFNRRDGNINIDPVGAVNQNQEWWGEFIDGSDLANIFASEVEGEEGARLVGVTNTNNESEVSRVGETLQNGLQRNEILLADNMKNLRLLASVDMAIDNNQSVLIHNSFNFDSVDFVIYSKIAVAENGTTDRIGYITINFTNPIPTPYLYRFNDIFHGYLNQGSKIYLHKAAYSVASPTATSISLGKLVLDDRQGIDTPPAPGSWPPVWGIEDPASRVFGLINFQCFVLD